MWHWKDSSEQPLLLTPQARSLILGQPSMPRIYVQQLLIATVLLVMLCGLVNYVVDPYGMNNTFSITGINKIKPETETHERLYKASIIAERHPSIIALGTSRTDRGLSMQHSGWGGKTSERYNAALVGANMYEIWRYFEYANRTHQLKRVVLGLDLLAFNYYKTNQADLDETLLPVEQQSFDIDTFLRHIEIYFSLGTAISSKKTINGNCADCYSPFLTDGQQNPQVFDQAWRESGGHYRLFLRNDMVAVSYLHFPPPSYKFALMPPSPNEKSQLYYLQRLIQTARRDDIDLRLFISPSHARQWEALYAAGLWPEFERWKKELVQMLGDDSKQHPDKAPIPLWDFSGYNNISTESVPSSNDSGAHMQWYWESSHYKKEVGDMILDRIFDHHEFSRIAPSDFGVRLASENLSSQLSNIRLAGESYRLAHSQETAMIEQLAKDAMAARESRLRRIYQ